MAKAPQQTATFDIPELRLEVINVHIIGESPLIVHAWSPKAKKAMLDKQMKVASAGRQAKDPWMDFCESLYWLDGMPAKPTEAQVKKGRFGFPSIAFKAAAVSAATSIPGVTKVAMRQAFHIDAEMIPILGGPPSMREDMVRVGMGTADIRHRGEFSPWAAVLPIRYNTGALSAAQIITLLNAGGFGVGVGEWRPEKDGMNGRFRVASAKDMKAFGK